MQKIAPFLWFDDDAEAAVNFYTSIFENARTQNLMRMPDGKVLTVSFTLDGQTFTALNGGPLYKFNPAVSFFVMCETPAEVDALWERLTEGGSIMMPLDKYDWSARYGWGQDRFGVSWQVMLSERAAGAPKFVPCLMFAGDLHARAGEAVDFYTSVFKNSSVETMMRYPPEGAETVGRVLHARFSLDGNIFVIMGSAMPHAFSINEAISFVITCDTQTEIDYYWETLTADGGAESRCGWLKDKLGVSWQVVPAALGQILGNPDAAKAQYAMQALMQMNKIDIAALSN